MTTTIWPDLGRKLSQVTIVKGMVIIPVEAIGYDGITIEFYDSVTGKIFYEQKITLGEGDGMIPIEESQLGDHNPETLRARARSYTGQTYEINMIEEREA